MTIEHKRLKDIAWCIYESAAQDMPELEGDVEAAQDIIPNFFYAGSPIANGCTKEEEEAWRALSEEEQNQIIEEFV